MISIYKISNPVGSVYIGQTINLKKRLRAYKAKDCKSQRYLYHSIERYGFENHTFEICHELSDDCSQNVVDSYEQLYIDFYKAAGFKMMNIKGAGSRGKASEETKKRMSESNKGIYHREGWKPTPEHLGKIRLANLGRKRTQEQKDAASKMRKGISPPLETIAKARAANIGNKYNLGRKRPDVALRNKLNNPQWQ